MEDVAASGATHADVVPVDPSTNELTARPAVNPSGRLRAVATRVPPRHRGGHRSPTAGSSPPYAAGGAPMKRQTALAVCRNATETRKVREDPDARDST